MSRNTDKADAIFAGARALLHDHGLTSLAEVGLPGGLRADIVAWDHKGTLHIVEVKSGIEDFRSDSKWQGYLDWCDQYHFAVAPDFPVDILPADAGLILADAHGGDWLRIGPAEPLAAARRKKMLILLAQKSAGRLFSLERALTGVEG